MAKRDLRRVERAAKRLKDARLELAAAILAASRSGESIRDIAPHAGVSSTRVHDLLREAQQHEGDQPGE